MYYNAKECVFKLTPLKTINASERNYATDTAEPCYKYDANSIEICLKIDLKSS